MGDITKNCIKLTKDFKKSKVKGYTRSNTWTYDLVSGKYDYTAAEYKENGYYYPTQKSRSMLMIQMV